MTKLYETIDHSDRALVTLDQWFTFYAVYQEGGVHAAARALGRSHSSISHALARVETLLDLELFRREGRNLVPTAAGETMARHALRVVAHARDTERLAESLKQGWESELQVAVESIVPMTWLAEILNTFHADSRGTRVRLSRPLMESAAAATQNDRFDVVLASTLAHGVTPNPIVEVPFGLVVRQGHPELGNLSAVSALGRLVQVVIGEPEPTRDRGWLRAEQRWTVPDFESALTLVARSDAFAVLPLALVEDALARGSIVALETGRIPYTRQLHLICPKGAHLGPAARLLRECTEAWATRLRHDG